MRIIESLNSRSPEPASVSAQTVTMQDDSMAPIFVKGDELTINDEVAEEPGDYMLVRVGHLLLIRRYTDRGDNDHFDFIAENPAYPAILDDGSPDTWGVVSSIRHIDGTIHTFDLSSRRTPSELLSELEASIEMEAPSEALPVAALCTCI